MFTENKIVKFGDDDFHWFFGVIEDNDDPLKLGRVRVRVIGDHTQKKEGRIPTDGLPWAIHIVTSPNTQMNGMGNSPTNLYKGTWVVGFYIDGPNKQMPLIFGSFGGVPRGLPNKEIGFNDPDGKFPMGHMIFEQDTNRLARGAVERGVEIPESIVDKRERFCDDTICHLDAVYAKEYYDKFDEKYVKWFDRKHYDDDTTEDPEEPKKKDDNQCQYVLNNNHPNLVYKFINRQRFIPISKPFFDPIHREFWHENISPYNAKYPYNKVWEGYHEKGGAKEYAYDQTITDYDGSMIEGVHRKQNCGEGSWGHIEEWDSTPGQERYHRVHKKGNYLEIDKDGNEIRKIYGENFEIDLDNKSIYIDGDWNITVAGDKNELIEGDYNLQIMKDFKTDVRGSIKTHSDEESEYHYKENLRVRVDGDEKRRVSGDRNTSILKRDYIESVDAERRANTIVRKGAESMIDEAFKLYELKVYDMEMSVCNLESEIKTWNNVSETKTDDIMNLTEKINIQKIDVNILEENTGTHTESKQIHNEYLTTYNGCVDFWQIHTIDFEVFYRDNLLFEKGGHGGGCSSQGGGGVPLFPDVVDVGQVNYPETDGIQQCLKRYNECIEAAKSNCTTTIIDPRVVDENGNPKTEDRVDWEKYHASIQSCKLSYEACVEANKGLECDVCAPSQGSLSWDCMGCHSTDCPTDDKKVVNIDCLTVPCDKIEGPPDVTVIDPWKDCEQEKP